MSGEALSRPPLDAGIAEILSKLPPMHFPTNSDEISQFHEAVLESLAPATDAILSDPNIQIESSQINGPRGDIPLVILRPKSAISSSDLCPGILFLHGGAMISGNPFNGLNIVSDMITELNAVVISVDYRLAPRHQDLGLVEDCYAALVWIGSHTHQLGIDEDRLLVVGGSAGGGLAAGTVLMARDQQAPKLCGQLLSGPMLDDRNTTVSAQQSLDLNDGSYDTTQNRTAWGFVLGDRAAGSDVSCYNVAPARAHDLFRLPQAYIDVGLNKLFRDEAVAYTLRMWEGGSQADLHVWAGGCL